MFFGGIQKVTLIDYPEKIACTLFTIGCNFKCPFCYSPELVLPEKIKKQPKIKEGEVINFLKKRVKKIEGVVLCGGEPTIQKDIEKFIKKVKKLGYLVKLDTNGYLPSVIKNLIKKRILDYIAMDIKAPPEKYKKYTGIKNLNIKKINQSIQIIKSSKIDYEFRTTLAPGLSKKDIINIAKWISPGKRYYLQQFFSQKEIIDPKIKKLPILKEKETREIINKIKSKFEICKLR